MQIRTEDAEAHTDENVIPMYNHSQESMCVTKRILEEGNAGDKQHRLSKLFLDEILAQ